MEPTFTEFAHLKIPLEEIQEATNNFAEKNIIGKGGFGIVYKGKINRSGKSIKIVARRLGRNQWQGDVEFWTEISMLSTIKHDNIVSLIGYCDEKGDKIIINRLYAKGSLVRYLSDPTTLSWFHRLKICFHVACAIRHIHNNLYESYYIIHRNINSSTIVLDHNFDDGGVRLSGFEHSIKHSVDRKDQVYIGEAIGTQGYMDPAIETTKGVNHKSDIYSFGVVLFEMLCGRKAFQDNKLLAPLAKNHYENGTLSEIIHPDLWNQMNPESFKFFSEVAYSCLHEDPTQRPDVAELTNILYMAYIVHFDHPTHDKVKEDNESMDECLVSEGDKMFESFTPSEVDKMLESLQPCTNKWRILNTIVEGANLEHNFLKVKNLEHLRIEARDILLATHTINLPQSFEGHSEYLNIANLECFNRECFLSVKDLNKDELPKKQYTVMVKQIHIDDYLEKYGEEYSCKEIEILSSCNHENIECLLGFSEVYSCTVLVSKFVSTNYLSTYLDDQILTWETRLKICIDVARGLNYLHHEMVDQKMVIHGNINSKNIMLDNNWSAKIVEFGGAVFFTSNQDDNFVHLNVIDATNLYMDPEYNETGILNRESDVFSFGVVMLEILCGMYANDLMDYEDGNDKSLGHLAKRWLKEGITKRMVNPRVNEENVKTFVLHKGPNEEFLETFITIMHQCLELKQIQRPTMQVVIKELEKALCFQKNNKDTLRISFQEIESATHNFSNCIGGGGFGCVFKGEVSHGNGTQHSIIVAKKLDKSQGQGEKQFYNELQILYDYKHENVIGLVGYSDETDEKIIVYEHAPLGSLDKHLNNARLTWRNRLKICIDVVAGLDFLHGGVEGKDVVIHRDIKTANVLLFDDWKAKLGDFGLSLVSTISIDSNYAIDHACGTKGYVDESYLKSSILTIESDIYSFGVVLFEILYGRELFAIPRNKGVSLLSFIKQMVEQGKEGDLIFEAIKDEIGSKSLDAFLNIVYKCLDDNREKRPTSKEVLAQLKNALELQVSYHVLFY